MRKYSTLMFGFMALLYISPVLARDLTFFIWSDTHFGASYESDMSRLDIIEQMNKLPGTNYPDGGFSGETIAEPSFVIHLGDITENGFESEWNSPHLQAHLSYIQTIEHLTVTEQQFEVVGNHDAFEGTVTRSLLAQKHGQTYYSFNRNRVHFVMLDAYPFCNPSMPCLGEEQLLWLKDDLESLNARTPVVICMHTGPGSLYDAQPEAQRRKEQFEQLLDIVSRANVLVFLQGHIEATGVFKWNGFDVVSPAGIAFDSYDCINCEYVIAVVTITNNQMTILSYDWQNKEFLQEPLFVKTFGRDSNPQKNKPGKNR